MKTRNKRIYAPAGRVKELHDEYRYYSGLETVIMGDHLLVLAVRKTPALTENQLRKEQGLPVYKV